MPATPFRLRLGLSLTVFALAAISTAEIRYTVQLSPDKKKFLVTIDADVKKGVKEIAFQMPRWSPGSYGYDDQGKEVTEVEAKAFGGDKLSVEHPDFSTWKISNPPSRVVLGYQVNADVAGDVMQVSGPSTYMYVVDRKKEQCSVSVDVPEDWPIMTGLMPGKQTRKNLFVAPNYDVLADNPITSGKFYADSYMVNGKQHYIALRGSSEDVAAIDKVKLHKITRYVSSMISNFWGGEPYDHYVWHFVAFKSPDGGWGLEHLSSTQIGLATGFGMNTDGVIAHELFHAWNVKRIRSKPLGPFDYQTLPKTGALWWLEGVTDYYAHMLLRRYNWTDDARYYTVIARNVNVQRGNAERLNVSPYDSSYRVSEANGGRGNSSGFGVNYYNTGWLVGLCLDMAIREKTDNKKSLDDVSRNLFRKYGKGQPGFEEDGIRKELVAVGGKSMGDMYDEIVMKPGELPIEDALAKAGLRLNQKDEEYADLGFKYDFDMAAMGLRVSAPADFTNLKEGDLITAINNVIFKTSSREDSFAAVRSLQNPEVGKVIHLLIQRKDVADPIQIDVTPASKTRKIWGVEEKSDATLPQIALRKAWLTPPAGWMPPQ
jgi:predicted metalloprotease with PDZ domain